MVNGDAYKFWMTIFHKANRIAQSFSTDGLNATFLDAIQELGVEAVLMQEATSDVVKSTVLCTYPEYICKGYNDRGCYQIDPFFARAWETHVPVTCSDIIAEGNLSPDIERFVSAMHTHNLGDAVVMVLDAQAERR